ncbi:hypothetical protein B9G54_04690 [Alloscardovia macacae]|uniref:Type II secretion system protein GspF domain-containing protein n=2 Tax=Alloscardovia macacae TaxID=1160091 RepID=A0A1Y2SZF9_9BIFI|nr:hypothetical protein B9G54_04690 [Alloscardovia macacae]OTA29831.1 hypothetical protein B9T39_01760 [Alloscardovia macacae]
MTYEELVTTLITLLRSGMTLVEACAQIRQQGSASAVLDDYTLRALVRDRVEERPRAERAYSFTQQLYAVCKLSEISGCSAVQCLEILHEDVKRSRVRARRKADAIAVAVLTVRVLCALPLFTLLLGELTGTQALSFLLTTRVGWCCLAVTCACYVCGGLWTRALLQAFEKATKPRLGYGSSVRGSPHSRRAR